MEEFRVRKHIDAAGVVHVETEPVEPDVEKLTPEEKEARAKLQLARSVEKIANSPLLQRPVLSIFWAVFWGVFWGLAALMIVLFAITLLFDGRITIG